MTRSPNCRKYIVHDMCFFVTLSCSPRRFVSCFAVYGAALAGTIRRRRRLFRLSLNTPPAPPISLAAQYGYAWWAPSQGALGVGYFACRSIRRRLRLYRYRSIRLRMVGPLLGGPKRPARRAGHSRAYARKCPQGTST